MKVKQSYNNNTIKIEKVLRRCIAGGEEAANSLLGTNIPCPRLKISEFNAIYAARYNPKEKIILVNQKVFENIEPNNLKEKVVGTIAHEIVHHIQHTTSNSGNYLESTCIQFENAIKRAAIEAALRCNKENLNAKSIAEYIPNNDVELFRQSINRLIGEEALAYFVGAYAGVAADNSIDMYMKRAIMLRSLMFLIQPSDLINTIFNKNGISSSFIRDINNSIWGFGKMDEVGKSIVVDMTLSNMNGESMIAERIINYGIPFKIAILAFVENDFSVLKTAEFLFRPYEKVVNDLQKTEAEPFENIKKIDELYPSLIRWQSYKRIDDAADIIKKSIKKESRDQQQHRTIKRIFTVAIDLIKKYKNKR